MRSFFTNNPRWACLVGAVLLIAMSAPVASADDRYDDFLLIGVDAAHYYVYWVTGEGDGSELFRSQLTADKLWEDKLPPWLKPGLIYSAEYQDPREQEETGHLSFKHIDYLRDWGIIFRTIRFKSCDGGHWEWSGGNPMCVPGRLEFRDHFGQWMMSKEKSWSARDRLVLESYIFIQGGQNPIGPCREKINDKFIFSYVIGGCGDHELVDDIIKLAGDVRPLPAIPAEAVQHCFAANALMQNALNEEDTLKAVKEYDAAIRLAPWYIEPYYNEARGFEIIGLYNSAITQLKRYLALNPPEDDAQEARHRLQSLQTKWSSLRSED